LHQADRGFEISGVDQAVTGDGVGSPSICRGPVRREGLGGSGRVATVYDSITEGAEPGSPGRHDLGLVGFAVGSAAAVIGEHVLGHVVPPSRYRDRRLSAALPLRRTRPSPNRQPARVGFRAPAPDAYPAWP